jgi:rhodanese-related sulfurtransferase/CBS domain-containing protein
LSLRTATVDLKGLRQLIADGAQLVEVLPAEEYAELHLPGAINIPLKQLDAESARQLDRRQDIIVYCWDALCDMSPRAACRLATLGFTHVQDYAPGKVDWLAHGLPAEGTHAKLPTAGSLTRQDAATCALDCSVADARRAIADSPYGFALVLSPQDVLLGRVRRSALDGLADADRIEPILEPGPSTIRPHLLLEELHRKLRGSAVHTLIVTRPDGTLLGVVRGDDVTQLDAS